MAGFSAALGNVRVLYITNLLPKTFVDIYRVRIIKPTLVHRVPSIGAGPLCPNVWKTKDQKSHILTKAPKNTTTNIWVDIIILAD